MEKFIGITRDQIENRIEGEHLRINRIISAALIIGPSLFFIIILFLYYYNVSTDLSINPYSAVDAMIYALVALGIVIYATFLIFPIFFLKKENIEKQLTSIVSDQKGEKITDPSLRIIFLDRALMIIRLAMLEFIALFGLVVLMLSVTDKQIYANENYWLLTIPLIVLIIFTVMNNFSKEKILDRIQNNILMRLRNW